MDKFRFWQPLINLTKTQKSDLGWWLIVLVFLGMSVGTVLVWRSLLKDHHSHVAINLSLETAQIQPPTALQSPSSTKLIFAGSGVSLEITRLLAKQFLKTHPEIKIDVPASIGSGGAIQAAADGAISMGMPSRPLKADEKNLGLTVIAIAQTPLAFAVHPSVADNNITSAQLLNIYQGKKTQWLNGQEIIVLTREPSDSSILILEQRINGFKQVYAASNKAERWITL